MKSRVGFSVAVAVCGLVAGWGSSADAGPFGLLHGDAAVAYVTPVSYTCAAPVVDTGCSSQIVCGNECYVGRSRGRRSRRCRMPRRGRRGMSCCYCEPMTCCSSSCAAPTCAAPAGCAAPNTCAAPITCAAPTTCDNCIPCHCGRRGRRGMGCGRRSGMRRAGRMCGGRRGRRGGCSVVCTYTVDCCDSGCVDSCISDCNPCHVSCGGRRRGRQCGGRARGRRAACCVTTSCCEPVHCCAPACGGRRLRGRRRQCGYVCCEASNYGCTGVNVNCTENLAAPVVEAPVETVVTPPQG